MSCPPTENRLSYSASNALPTEASIIGVTYVHGEQTMEVLRDSTTSIIISHGNESQQDSYPSPAAGGGP